MPQNYQKTSQYLRILYYPIYKGYSKCTTIPNDIKPDWLEGIKFINQLREKLVKENPNLDPHTKN